MIIKLHVYFPVLYTHCCCCCCSLSFLFSAAYVYGSLRRQICSIFRAHYPLPPLSITQFKNSWTVRERERKFQTSKLHLKFCSGIKNVNGSHSTFSLLSLEAFDGKTWNKFIAAAAIKLVQTAVQVVRKAKWSKFDMFFFRFHCFIFFFFFLFSFWLRK